VRSSGTPACGTARRVGRCRRIMALLAAIAVSVAATSSAQATSTVLWLDTYAPPTGYEGAVTSARTGAAAPGSYLVATVSGTFSYWSADQYDMPTTPWDTMCGAAEPAATYASPDGVTGPVGMDAEWIFGRPWTTAECSLLPLPRRGGVFQIDTGSGFADRLPMGPATSGPMAGHKYRYALVGAGASLAFRLLDGPGAADNYGQLRIDLNTATAADCADYQGFGAPSQAACLEQIARQAATAPPSAATSGGGFGGASGTPTACRSRRTLRIHVPRRWKGSRVQTATLRVNSRPVAIRRRSGRFVALIDLRRLPRRVVPVALRWRTVDGKRYERRTALRTCVPQSSRT
jgi:hypothetical protein